MSESLFWVSHGILFTLTVFVLGAVFFLYRHYGQPLLNRLNRPVCEAPGGGPWLALPSEECVYAPFLALCIITVLNMTMAAQTRPVIRADSPLSWVEIIPSASENFTSTVNEVVGPNVAGMIASVLPYSALVTNSGSIPLVGIDIRFSLNVDGRVVTKNFFYHSFNTRESPILLPGQSRLFTPLKTANAVAAGTGSALMRGGGVSIGPSPGDSAHMRDLTSAQAITISVDLAIAADGRTAGDDKAGTLKKLRQTMEAYRAMREECLSRLTRGDSDLFIEAWLTQIATQLVMKDKETGAGDRYAAMQKGLANKWLGYIRTGKRSDLQAMLPTDTPEAVFPYVISLKKGGLQ